MGWVQKWTAFLAVISGGQLLLVHNDFFNWFLVFDNTSSQSNSLGTIRRPESNELKESVGNVRIRNEDDQMDALWSAASSGDLKKYDGEYTPPAFEETKFRSKPAPVPIQVMRQYIQWHSDESLRRTPHHRKFAVAFYSCPVSAGNNLHMFMNGLLWSILTNRTVLWKYWDYPACLDHHVMPLSRQGCAVTVNNTIQDCDPILDRAPWIPSYDKWSVRLNLPKQVPIPDYATHPKSWLTRIAVWDPEHSPNVRGIDIKYENDQVVYFPQYFHLPIPYLANWGSAETFLHSDASRIVNAKLHDYGVDFLYGMLLRYCFDFTKAIKKSVPESFLRLNHSSYYTIAMHFRHARIRDDGCDVQEETNCLSRVLDQQRRKANTTAAMNCLAILMSDRNCTLATLTDWLRQNGCAAVVSNHTVQSSHVAMLEHGPFAGAGYFHDLVLASQARSAFVGSRRSSSALLREMIAFHVKMEAWQASIRADAEDLLRLRSTRLDECLLHAGSIDNKFDD